MPLADYYDTKSAAEKLGVTPGRLRQLRLKGRFPSAIRVGNAWCYPARYVNNFKRKKGGRPRKLQLKPGAQPRNLGTGNKNPNEKQ